MNWCRAVTKLSEYPLNTGLPRWDFGNHEKRWLASLMDMTKLKAVVTFCSCYYHKKWLKLVNFGQQNFKTLSLIQLLFSSSISFVLSSSAVPCFLAQSEIRYAGSGKCMEVTKPKTNSKAWNSVGTKHYDQLNPCLDGC